jgi:DNA excision repair protein ERCC-2
MITGYDPTSRCLTTGIGSLIEFGRLPDTLVPQENPIGLLARQRAHAGYQSRMLREGWEREVQVELAVSVKQIRFVIRGRMDLVRRTPEGIAVIEAKTAPTSPAFLDPFASNPHHVLQLFFYARALEVSGEAPVSASMVYLPMTGRGRSPREFPIDLLRPDIITAWEDLLTGTAEWLLAEDDRRKLQVEALEAFEFPFYTLRPGQREMAEAVQAAVAGSTCLMVQAPTGTGKTAAVLAGGLRASLPARLTLFFLTAKNTHKRIVLETARRLVERGLPIRMIVLTSREGSCARGREICFPDDCPFANDFSAKVIGSGAMGRLLTQGIIGPESLMEEAVSAGVCPFELGLCISTRCDVVCGDYNYVFDPHVFLRRFFVDRQAAAACAVLVDEAANLPARARDYYSPEVRLSWLRSLDRWRKGRPRSLTKLLRLWLEAFEVWGTLLDANGGTEMELPVGTDLPVSADSWTTLAGKVKDPPREFLHMLRSVGDLARLGPRPDSRFHLLFRREAADSAVQWFCTDPSGFLSQRVGTCRSTVAFSATLSPFEHFRGQLGLPEDATGILSVPYPFPPENLGVWVDPRVDTRWTARKTSLGLLVRRLEGIYAAAPGTWLVFLPSFVYLELVRGRLEESGLPVIAQTPGMSSTAREGFLSLLTDGGKLALVVSGGVFAEGVDIRSGQMRGAVVVGPSLPAMDLRSGLLASSFEETGTDGFLHASVIPGMVRVVQAAGRLIRSEEERRVLVLMGKRFTRNPYIGLLPPHWFRGGWLPVLSDGLEEIMDFFGGMSEGRRDAPPLGDQRSVGATWGWEESQG